MRAIVYERYGSPDVLELREIDKPLVADDGYYDLTDIQPKVPYWF